MYLCILTVTKRKRYRNCEWMYYQTSRLLFIAMLPHNDRFMH